MRRSEAGFTLIELVIVLVILGILGAVAIPKFQDFSTDAKNAAAAGGKSAVSSAYAIASANAKGAVDGSAIAAFLPGSSCDAGKIIIDNTSASGQVEVALTGGSCSTVITSIGSAIYSG